MKMTDTPSQREVDLVEAAMDLRRIFRGCDESRNIATDVAITIKTIIDALKAYDPKPEPVPVIPEWKEFVNIIARDPSVAGVALKDPDFLRIDEAQYNAIRKATARMPD